mmetsp:Transcript_39223/g.80250  ORF Transcript_39223/g.80250 Transcript_39223/m.80250 type:complete len:119 (+) Transcript_39223:242-598(+)
MSKIKITVPAPIPPSLGAPSLGAGVGAAVGAGVGAGVGGIGSGVVDEVVVVVVVVQLHQTSKTLAKASMVRNSSRPDVYERLQHPSPRRGPVAAAAAPPSVPAAAGAADDGAPAVAQV